MKARNKQTGAVFDSSDTAVLASWKAQPGKYELLVDADEAPELHEPKTPAKRGGKPSAAKTNG